ncbi:MAG: biotin/lipoyl-containing protein [Mobilitalea sp.]
MKFYTITVNGRAYDVQVEEGARTMQAAPVYAAPAVSAPVAAPVQAPAVQQAAAPMAPAAAGAEGSVKISSPMPGKIVAIKVAVGQAVKKGEALVVLEAMKMENEIVAPQAGTVASINVAAGQMVEAGNLLATLN